MDAGDVAEGRKTSGIEGVRHTFAGREIPRLDPEMQAVELPHPVTKWGSIARSSAMSGTYHHFTEDVKFRAHWVKPDRLPASGCRVAVEVNYSSWPDQPIDDVLKGIYKKRWLARYWQSRGVRIVVDLNVADGFRDCALLGVPAGWRAYATRKHWATTVGEIEDDWRAARDHAGGPDGLMFVVFGGWKQVRDLCRERGWAWVPENIHAVRGSVDGTRRWK
jgi:hypothetical protein